MRQLVISQQITNRNLESVSRYFREINKFSLVTAEEEVELSARIRSGDNDALKRLVVANLRFVVSVAKQYQNRGLSFPDLINEGNIGLVTAANKFDETKGFKFISYAVWWIRQSIIQAISEQTRIVRLPINRISSINKITNAIPYLEQEYEREPTDEEIAQHLDLDNNEVFIANNIKKRQISLDVPLTSNDDDYSLYNLLENENTPRPDNGLARESLAINISRVLKKLSKRESAVIIMLFGLAGSPIFSLQDVASKYNMTRERIRQIKMKGLNKMKHMLAKNKEFL